MKRSRNGVSEGSGWFSAGDVAHSLLPFFRFSSSSNLVCAIVPSQMNVQVSEKDTLRVSLILVDFRLIVKRGEGGPTWWLSAEAAATA